MVPKTVWFLSFFKILLCSAEERKRFWFGGNHDVYFSEFFEHIKIFYQSINQILFVEHLTTAKKVHEMLSSKTSIQKNITFIPL